MDYDNIAPVTEADHIFYCCCIVAAVKLMNAAIMLTAWHIVVVIVEVSRRIIHTLRKSTY